MKHIDHQLLNKQFNRALCIIALSCASLSTIAEEYLPADAVPLNASEEKFPNIKVSYLKIGNFVDKDNVRRVVAGLSKDQVRLQLGNPHFSEGLFGVKMWDYTFNFYTGKGNEYAICQYKIKFDRDYFVKSIYWKDNQCESYINPPAAVPVIAAAPPTPEKQLITIQADGLFAFNKSSLDSMMSPGREKLSNLAHQVKQANVNVAMITVAGYADSIGSSVANQALSEARANTVRSYLAQQGVDGKLIRAYGAGESNPVAECTGANVTPELVKCLQPNRRVEIEILKME